MFLWMSEVILGQLSCQFAYVERLRTPQVMRRLNVLSAVLIICLVHGFGRSLGRPEFPVHCIIAKHCKA
ncbi:hypothetical protein, partial [Pseudomonas syringae group genomosp. 7]|uniref:hypothetical protein n=1 Tax=Pseudomonas syringae group genomosp. 7 TaxID=251699 RepID=UPI0037701C08